MAKKIRDGKDQVIHNIDKFGLSVNSRVDKSEKFDKSK